jgi:predicted nucleic acid-binding protein
LNIVCNNYKKNGKKALDEILKEIIRTVLSTIINDFFKDIITKTHVVNFEKVFRGLMISFIIDALYSVVCDDPSQNKKMKASLCQEMKLVSNIIINMRIANASSSRMVSSYIITKIRKKCGLPKLQGVIKSALKKQIIEHLNKNDKII